ncbi:hypothetical protein WKH56_08710 [Priestia sp. SB1]|uniref:hypothetical protein n=1 Tax=Priestia sp. SB1 TaxID=3132359 RepID=UPI0031816CFF
MEEGFKKYIECMEYIQSHPEYKDEYEAYFKNVTDEANRLYTAREEGKQEARDETRKNLVTILLEEGYSPTYIEKEFDYDPIPYIESLYNISLNQKKE